MESYRSLIHPNQNLMILHTENLKTRIFDSTGADPVDIVDIVHLRAKSLGKFQPFGEQFNNMKHRRPVLPSKLCSLTSKKVATGTLIQIFLGNSDISSGS